jgi:L-ascorbate metabolism protein UlaG (beta-lactamase superfamily)
MIDQIRWAGHGSFTIQGPPLIYINPWRVLRTAFLADVILISHDHYEHFSAGDVQKLRGPQTIILTNEKVAAEIDGAQVLRPYHSITVDRARITAIPAYSPDGVVHPQADGGLGFLVSVNFYDIYYAGDTGETPEMMRVQPDIAMLPIDDNGTLSVEQAADIVKRMRPRYVYPMNWGTPDITNSASRKDAIAFRDLVADRAEVVLPPDVEEPTKRLLFE